MQKIGVRSIAVKIFPEIRKVHTLIRKCLCLYKLKQPLWFSNHPVISDGIVGYA